ncbi:MAG TPA: ubiquitin carboxyl-terminal hydrolase family protein, partial [Chlamydiales bacterium]|nr:ubiquitin carboxyl-terminal hydrolase family protein [Chlamydiales bacterium]
YAFPSLELNFNPQNPLPSLSSMMNDTHLDQVNEEGTVRISRSFAEVPPVFVYRFTRLEGVYVNRTEVDVPLYQEILATNGHQGMLQLQGFIRHSGGANGGHYVSYIAQQGKFWLLNDEKVSAISAADYLLAARHATAALYSRVA